LTLPSIAIELRKKIYIPLYDLQGNIASLLDPQIRKVIESYLYSAYGEEEIIDEKGHTLSDSSLGNPWRYRGKRVDKEVGLLYFGYRYYDPEIGRWITPDPLGNIDGPNLYAYAHNNPMKYVDFFGLSAKLDENCGCIKHDHPGWHHAPEGCVCICGMDNYIEIYRSVIGSDIKSAIFGISHGVVDFVLGSLHDLQTAAVYMGSAELEMSLHERIQITKIANKLQPGFQKIDKAVKAVEEFLGGKGKVITNADGDMILMRGDRKIRFDIKDPHVEKPHFHLEKENPKGQWVDVGPEHHYYFMEE
jgi:RHS repeat-associated protein